VRKATQAAAVAAAFSLAASAPAVAGQVYGDYGQNNQYAQGTYHDSRCSDVDVAVGTGLGAIVGGVIGSQFGKGRGKTAATVGGVILGGIVGNQIAKDACRDERSDAYYYNPAYVDAFNDPNEGQEYNWRNPYTDNYGSVTPGAYYAEGYEGYSGPCRQFSQRVYIDGRLETAYGVACLQPDGTWRIVG
jgi:surface antigen